MTTAVVQRVSPALSLPENTSFKQWEKLGKDLFQAARDLPWMIGDWLNFGERKYGERYAQALEMGRYDYVTLRKCSWVCRHVPPERRRPSSVLSFKHHEVITPLEPEEQEEMLDLAERESLTVEELRYEVKRLRDPSLPGPPQPMVFDDWWTKYTVIPRQSPRETYEQIARDAWRTARETK